MTCCSSNKFSASSYKVIYLSSCYVCVLGVFWVNGIQEIPGTYYGLGVMLYVGQTNQNYKPKPQYQHEQNEIWCNYLMWKLIWNVADAADMDCIIIKIRARKRTKISVATLKHAICNDIVIWHFVFGPGHNESTEGQQEFFKVSYLFKIRPEDELFVIFSFLKKHKN